MVNCAVISCKNDSRRQTKQNSNVTFHRFPKREELLSRWVRALQRPGWEPTIRSFVCSAHFPDTSMYFSKSGLRKLTPEAVPELGLDVPEDKPKRRRKTSKVRQVCAARLERTKRRSSSPDCREKRVTRSKNDLYAPNESDSPRHAKLKKRILKLTKLAKRRRLRCNALYAGLYRIKKKVAALTQLFKKIQCDVVDNAELNHRLESCGVTTDELFNGLWKKERSDSPEPLDVEDYFYAEIPTNMESYIEQESRSRPVIYSTSIRPAQPGPGGERLPAWDFGDDEAEVKMEMCPPSPPLAGGGEGGSCGVCGARGGLAPVGGDLTDIYLRVLGDKAGGAEDVICPACARALSRLARAACSRPHLATT